MTKREQSGDVVLAMKPMDQEGVAREAALRQRYNLSADFVGQVQDVETTYTYLRGFFEGAGMQSSRRALGDMLRLHDGQYREGGMPYIIHPMQMACHAIEYWRPGDTILTDDFFAILLLHDVEEDVTGSINVSVHEMGYNDVISRGVSYMTLTRFKNETKYELKKRYYNELPAEKYAALGKGFDKSDNLATMITSFRDDAMRIRKNVVEVDTLTLAMLRRARDKWPGAGSLFQGLKRGIRMMNIMLAVTYGVRLTDPNFINAPDAKDYSYLLTEAK